MDTDHEPAAVILANANIHVRPHRLRDEAPLLPHAGGDGEGGSAQRSGNAVVVANVAVPRLAADLCQLLIRRAVLRELLPRPLVGHACAPDVDERGVHPDAQPLAVDDGPQFGARRLPLPRRRRGEAGELGAEGVPLGLGRSEAPLRRGKLRPQLAATRDLCLSLRVQATHLVPLALRLLGAGDGGFQFAVHGVCGVFPRRLTSQRASRLVERARWRVHAHSLLRVCVARARRILRAEVLADAHTLAILVFVR